MSEEQQVNAIGRAVKAAAECKKNLLVMESVLDGASESFRMAHEAVREIPAGGEPGQGRDIYKSLKALPDIQKLRELIIEFAETRHRSAELAERAKQLSGL